MFSTSASHALCRVSQIASPAGRHVLFDVTQIYRTVLCEMDTRALKNPYHDYDGNPALTRELFDSHGRVRKDGEIDGDSCTWNRRVFSLLLSAHTRVFAAAVLQNPRTSFSDGEWAEVCRPQRLHQLHRLGR